MELNEAENLKKYMLYGYILCGKKEWKEPRAFNSGKLIVFYLRILKAFFHG